MRNERIAWTMRRGLSLGWHWDNGDWRRTIHWGHWAPECDLPWIKDKYYAEASLSLPSFLNTVADHHALLKCDSVITRAYHDTDWDSFLVCIYLGQCLGQSLPAKNKRQSAEATGLVAFRNKAACTTLTNRHTGRARKPRTNTCKIQSGAVAAVLRRCVAALPAGQACKPRTDTCKIQSGAYKIKTLGLEVLSDNHNHYKPQKSWKNLTFYVEVLCWKKN